MCHQAILSNIVEYTITNLADRAYYIPGLYGIAYHSQVSKLYSMLLNTVGNSNIMASGFLNIPKYRKGTVKYGIKDFCKWQTCMGHLPHMELTGRTVLCESVTECEDLGSYRILVQTSSTQYTQAALNLFKKFFQ